MPARKELEIYRIEEFRTDWINMKNCDLETKYHVSANTIQRWSKDYKCRKPKHEKPVIDNIYLTNQIVTPQSVIADITKKDLNKLSVQETEELKACSEKFTNAINDDSIPKREKDILLFSIAEKIMGIFISMQPNVKQYVESVYEFYKLKLYERRIDISGKESAELDSATIRNLKKKFITEAFESVCADLSPSEANFFDYLIQRATKNRLQRKKKDNEVMQQRVVEASGQPMTDTVVDTEVIQDVSSS